nr:RecName: Full=Endoglucanase A; Short=EGA; AltName: Full=Cellulase A; AltName: Full=Endo-1,4-beta-glucanase [Acetivibrio thermocellus]
AGVPFNTKTPYGPT